MLPDNTAKDRDYILEYKSIEIGDLSRENILGVPIDNVSRDEAVAVILDLVEKQEGPHHVLFMDPIKLMQLRPGKKLAPYVENARLVLSDGAGLTWAAEKLGSSLKERIPLIATLMDVVRLAEKKELTIYLLGSKLEYLERVFFNLQRSFPGVRIIGRQSGFFDPEREALIKESLRKSSPDIVFIGMGFPHQEKWISENLDSFSRAVVFSVDGALDVLSGRERKAPDYFQLRGLAWLWRIISRPWHVIKVFYTIQFYILTGWRAMRRNRALKKESQQAS